MNRATRGRMGRHMVAICCVAGLIYSCGGKEEPEAPALSSEPAPVGAPEAAGPTPEVSPTSRLLQYAPDDPAIVAVFPSLQALETRMVTLAKRLAPSAEEVDAGLAEWSANLASELGVAPAATPTAVFDGIGVDAGAPMAVYVDMAAFNERFKAEVERMKAEADAATDDNSTDSTEDMGDDFDGDASGDAAGESGFETLGPAVNPFEAAGLPAIAVAFTVDDVDTALAQLDAALMKSPAAANFDKREQDVNGVQVTVYDPEYCSYFVSDKVLVVSNQLAWLERVAARVQSPRPHAESVFDGTIEDEQIIAAVRLDQWAEYLEATTLANTLVPGQLGMMAEMQMQSWDEMAQAYSGTDPVVFTVRWNDARMALDARMNLDEHQALKAMSGAAQPMRLASALPDSTQAMFSMRLTPEIKASIRKFWIDAVPPEALQDPSVAGSVMGANQALELVDDEIVVGITGMTANAPSGIVMIGLTNPQAVIQQVGMFIMMAGGGMPEMPDEPGVVRELSFGPEMTFHYTVINNALLVATSHAEVEESVERIKAASTGGFFATLDPPIDAGLPRYFAFSMRPGVVENILAMQAGGGPVDPDVKHALNVFREFRVTQDMEGPWLVQHMGLYFNGQ